MESPVLAHAENIVHLSGISQRLIYVYDDPELNYAGAVKRGIHDRYLSEASENLQELINEEDKCFLGKKQLRWIVEGVVLDFWGGIPRYPVLVFSLSTRYELKPGIHVFRFYTPVSRVEYDISAVWMFPPVIRPRKFITRMDMAWSPSIIHTWATKGAVVGGWEELEIEVKELKV